MADDNQGPLPLGDHGIEPRTGLTIEVVRGFIKQHDGMIRKT